MNIADTLLSLPDLIGNAVESNQWVGYGAILIAMFLENLFPPIPSELIMPLGGFYIAQGQLSFLPVIIAGLIGTVLGAFPWYGLGRLANEEKIEIWLTKYGKWLGITPNELYKSNSSFSRYGIALVFWGRLIPGIRTLISVPAGIELMPFIPFIIWTAAGSLIWIICLTFAGIFLRESYSIVEVWMQPISSTIKLLLLAIIIVSFFIILIPKIYRKR